jgi:hypothetical protein
MKILVSGGRTWDNPNPIWAMLTGLYNLDSTNWSSSKFNPFVVIEGGQKQRVKPGSDGCLPGSEGYIGADYWAAQWCESPQIRHLHGPTLTPEQWEKGGRDGAEIEPMFYPGTAQPVVHYQYPADWDRYNKAAGPIRNSLMLKLHPDIDLVLAYHDDLEDGSRGTKDMCEKAEKAEIEVWHLERYLPPIKLL